MKRSPTLEQLLATVEPAPRYVGCGPDTTIAALQVDSRRVEPGAAFLALRGLTHDAHRFLPQAREAGATVLIVQDDAVGEVEGPCVRLRDTWAAYPTIAANFYERPADALRLAGVTGTNGKTTTAHLLGAALRHAQIPHARLGTTGNWLVDREDRSGFTTPFPLELQALLATVRERGGTHAVMEVSSHALAQGRTRPLRFSAVGLTSFSQDHLDFHASMDEYLDAKCRLASEHLAASGVAVAAVDAAPAAAQRFLDAADTPKRWRASRGAVPDAELLARRVEATPSGLKIELRTPVGEATLHSPLVGGFNVDNLLVTVGLGLGLGRPLAEICEALEHSTGAPGRLQRVPNPSGAGPAVLVDYAHTPDAVERALEALRPTCRGALVVVLGCGGDRDTKKRPLMGEVAARGADRFWATSDNPRTEDPDSIVDMMVAGVPDSLRDRVRRCTDRGEAIAAAIAEADDTDTILIAGKGHEDYQVLGDTTIHFDDREHAAMALARR